jgi:anti-sigma B factor antagonist
MEFYYHEVEQDVLIVSADGGLNKDTIGEFIDNIAGLIDAGLSKIIIDCSKLTFISSAELGALLRVHKRMKERGGDVKLAGLSGPVVGVIELTHLDKVFQIYRDVNRARLAFREPDAE